MKKVLKNISRVLFSLLLIVSIFGTFDVLAEEVIFKITNISVKEKSDKVTVNDVSLSGGSIVNDIIFTEKDDYIKYNITIKNMTSDEYTIKSIIDDNTSPYLEYTYDDLCNVKVEAGKEKTFELQIKYIQETTNLTISDQIVSLTLIYEKLDGTIGTENITNDNNSKIINPKTGDGITLYIIIGIVSLIGLTATTVSKKHLNKSLLSISIFSMVVIPCEIRADSELFKITVNNTIKEKEYNVSFNTNGGTQVNSIKVVRGNKVSRPNVDPTKENLYFDDWYINDLYEKEFDFNNTVITDETEIFAKYDSDSCRTFSTDSWDKINKKLKNNSRYYSVGCEKELEFDMNNDGTNESYTVRLANTSTPDVCSTNGYSQTACGLVIEFVDIVGDHRMTSTGSSAGGWIETEMVTWLNSDFYNKLPNDLKSIIIPTYPIVSGTPYQGTSENITVSNSDKNKIYLLSTLEVGIHHDSDNRNNELTDTRILDYYVGATSYQNDSVRIKKTLAGNPRLWWLRTANSASGGNTNFHGVSIYGGLFAVSVSSAYGVAPAFRIGNTN